MKVRKRLVVSLSAVLVGVLLQESTINALTNTILVTNTATVVSRFSEVKQQKILEKKFSGGCTQNRGYLGQIVMEEKYEPSCRVTVSLSGATARIVTLQYWDDEDLEWVEESRMKSSKGKAVIKIKSRNCGDIVDEYCEGTYEYRIFVLASKTQKLGMIKSPSFDIQFIALVKTVTTTVPAVTMSTQISDLKSFIDTYAKSVVTVSCGNSQGSGVSISATLSGTLKDRGFQSLVVTNQHVIYDCLTLDDTDVVVTINYGGVEYVGYALIYPSWNSVNDGSKPDLAAIFTTALIPATSFYGVVQPVLGHAVVAVGSAGGVPNVTTRGEVAGVTVTKIITTASAGHGSSGGALFNNRGQLLGFITAGNGTLVEVTPITELCKVIFPCTTPIAYAP